MVSSLDRKDHHRGSSGHIMVSFDGHDKCASCRDNKLVEEPYIICDGLSDTQKEMLSTPSYKTQKDKKSGVPSIKSSST